VLAKNTPVFNLTLSRELAGDTDAVVDNLARILDLTPAEKSRIEKDLRHARRAFEPVTLMLDLSEKQIALVAVNQFLLPGVEVQPQFLREYPLGEHFAHSVA
jgi:penicillin-binding protein 2